jgi:thiol-disulfide isomerase/thioredoxin
MNKFLLIIALLSINYSLKSQGVNFLKSGNLRTVFDQAKAQNKPVFIEVYSPDCHVCQAFKPTFDQKPVGDIYNKSFVSYKLDIGSEEAQGFLGKQNIWVPSIPVLLFFDKNVKLQHIAVMSETRNSPAILTDAAKVAQNAETRTSNYKNRFQKGVRDANFLLEYGLMARIQKDTLANIDAANEYFKTQKPANYTNSTNLLVLEKMILDSDNGLFKYMINNLPKYYAVKEKIKVNTIAENILMWTLYSSRGQNFNSAKIAQIKKDLTKVGVDQKSISGRVWMAESSAYFREKNPKAAIGVIENRLKGMKVSVGEAKYLCSFVRSKTIDKTALASAKKWCDLVK